MASNLTKTRFEDLLLEPVRNGIYKKKEFHGRGAKIVNMGELFRYPRLTDVEMKRVELTSNEVPKVLLKNGDLLFARRSLTAEGAGKCSIVREVNEPTTFESSIIRARPNPALADSDYLYYLYSSEIGYNLLDTIRRSVAVSGITGGDLKNLELDVPPLPEQKAIAHILGSLDDKIELNRRMNETLEGMAQALFKSWFVDFDPVLDNAILAGNPIPDEFAERAEVRRSVIAGSADVPVGTYINKANGANVDVGAPRALFPDSFQPSELGPIPTGWEVRSLEAMIQLIGGGTPQTSVEEYWNGDIPWFSVVDAPNESDVFVINTDKKITPAGVDNSSTKVLREGTTIISARGTVGKCALVGAEMAMNQSCYGIQGANGISDIYTYYTIREFVADLQQRGHGSVFNTITRDTFKSIHVPFGMTELTHIFDETVKSFLDRIRSNLSQNVELTKLRDTLLPKLISGVLRIEAKKRKSEKGSVRLSEKGSVRLNHC